MRSFVVLTAMPFVGKECCQRSAWRKDWRWINGNASNEAVASSTVSKCLLPARAVARLDQETLCPKTCFFRCTFPSISAASWTGAHKSSKGYLLWCPLLNRQLLFLLYSPRWRTISTSYLWRTKPSSLTTIEFDKSTSTKRKEKINNNIAIPDWTTTMKPELSSKAPLRINSVKCFVNELWLILKREMHIKPC